MAMRDEERRIIEARRAAVDVALMTFRNRPWETRAREAADQLTGINDDWWTRHEANPDAYALELLELNQLAGWHESDASVPTIIVHGRTFLLPPKFFGGNPALLHQDFVLAISLNHKVLKNYSAEPAELSDLQNRNSSLQAHLGYFQKAYAYRRFFFPREKVLRAYALARDLDVPEDWRAANERYSLYLEYYPTWSRKFRDPNRSSDQLEADSFVVALNQLSHRIVFGLLRPRAVLLAGKGTWSLVPNGHRVDVSQRLRNEQAYKCLCYIDRVELTPGARPSTVCRCNFLRTVYGPNSDTELEKLGRLLAE